MSLVVRRYQDSDKEIVNKMVLENFSYEKKKEDIPDNVYEYVLEANTKVVGYFVLTKNWDIVKNISYFLVDYVCIDLENQGQGYGQYMINNIKELAKEDNISFIQLTCSSKRACARHIYEKCGFSEAQTNLFRLVIE